MMETYTNDERAQIVDLFYQNGRSVKNVFRKLRNLYGKRKRPSESTISRIVQKYEETGSVEDRRRGQYNRSGRSKEHIDLVGESVDQQPELTISERSKQLGLSESTTWRILREDLALKPYKRKNKDRTESKKTEVSVEGTEEEKKLDTSFANIDFTCTKLSSNGKSWNYKISSWSVSSLKAVVERNEINFVKFESPDVMCFQETKCDVSGAPEKTLLDYFKYFTSGSQSGVALYSKIKPLNVSYGIQNSEYDKDGRIITAEYEDFYLVNTLVPNAGEKLEKLTKRLEWCSLLRSHISSLDKKKQVILCGNINVAPEEISVTKATFTQEEQNVFRELLKDGFVDTFQELYPDKTDAYTFWHCKWSSRSCNVGWRLDYFVVSERLMPAVCDSVIRSDVYGSDHCPITLFLSL